MSDYLRPSYFEALPPTQRVPDYVPTAPTPQPVTATADPLETAAAAAPLPAAECEPPATATVAAETAPTAVTLADKQTVKRTGRISSPVHQVQRPTGLAISFTLLVTEGEDCPTTYRVYATKQFAERLAKQALTQDSLVEVAGQPQLRDERQPDGASRSVPYFYCFGVRVLTPAST